VNHQIGESEKEGGDSARVVHKLVPAHERIENKPSIRESCGGSEVGGRDGASVRRVCFAKTGKEWDVVGTICVAVCVLDGIRIRSSGCVLGKDTEVGTRRMGEVLVNWKESDM
jgi:hypothetical protein